MLSPKVLLPIEVPISDLRGKFRYAFQVESLEFSFFLKVFFLGGYGMDFG